MSAKAAGENTPSRANVQDAVRKIEGFHTELLSERGAYMNRCQKIRAKINDALDLAKEQGIPKKELKALIRERDLRKKAAEIRLDLEKDERSTFDMLKEQLGALGNWAATQAEKGKNKRVQLAEPLKGIEQEQDLRGHQQKQTERERKAENGNGHGADGEAHGSDDTGDRPDAEALAKVGRGKATDDKLDDLTRH